MRHFVQGEALRDYLRCPQEYAYRYVYGAPEPPRTPQQYWDRAVRRTALSIVKELLEGRQVSHDKAAMLWQLTTKNTVVGSDARLEVLGRESIYEFWNWLDGFEPKGLAVTRQVSFEVTAKRSIDVGLQGRTPAWLDLGKKHASELNRLPVTVKREMAGAVEQGWRGIGHQIVWPNKDGRCTPCPYRDICGPGDSRRYLLKTKSKQKRVVERIKEQRSLGP